MSLNLDKSNVFLFWQLMLFFSVAHLLFQKRNIHQPPLVINKVMGDNKAVGVVAAASKVNSKRNLLVLFIIILIVFFLFLFCCN